MSHVDDSAAFLPTVSPLGSFNSTDLQSRGKHLDPSFIEDRNDPEEADYEAMPVVEGDGVEL